MRRPVFLLLLIFLSLLGILFWQKEAVLGRIREQPVLQPIFGPPIVYDLTNILEKHGFFVSREPVIINGNIYASVSGVLVTFSAQKDLSTQVRALQLVFPKVKMDGKLIKEIDLRFNKVVVRY